MTPRRSARPVAAATGAALALLLVAGAGVVAAQSGTVPAGAAGAAGATGTAQPVERAGPRRGVDPVEQALPTDRPVLAEALPADRPVEPAPQPVEPVEPPLPKPPAIVPVVNAADPGLDVVALLGPPPGPQADPRPARTAAPADRYALLVGVQDYRPPTADTIGSVADVRLIADSLVASGWPAQNVRVLTDADASGGAVREGLAWLAQHARPGTFALFHYSGHVKQHGGQRESLWPADRDFVHDTEVAAALGGVGGRLWVDIAGCQAGSFAEGLPSERVLFTGSSSATEKSYEYPPWGRSVWTGLMFDLALHQGLADADGNGRTTIGEALRWSTWSAQAITAGQRPHGRQTPQVAGDPVLGWTLADPPA